jgi:hypothetical protein
MAIDCNPSVVDRSGLIRCCSELQGLTTLRKKALAELNWRSVKLPQTSPDASEKDAFFKRSAPLESNAQMLEPAQMDMRHIFGGFCLGEPDIGWVWARGARGAPTQA